MDVRSSEPGVEATAIRPASPGGRLFRKFALLFAGIVSTALITDGLLDIWFVYREQKALLVRIQREQADAAAAKISQFIKEIHGQMGWTTQQAWNGGSIEQRRLRGVTPHPSSCRPSPSLRSLTRPAGSSSRFLAWRMDVDRQPDRPFQGASFYRGCSEQILLRPSLLSPSFRALHDDRPRRRASDAGVSIAEVNLTVHLGCGVADQGR